MHIMYSLQHNDGTSSLYVNKLVQLMQWESKSLIWLMFWFFSNDVVSHEIIENQCGNYVTLVYILLFQFVDYETLRMSLRWKNDKSLLNSHFQLTGSCQISFRSPIPEASSVFRSYQNWILYKTIATLFTTKRHKWLHNITIMLRPYSYS